MKHNMEKINITKLQGNQPCRSGEEQIPYKDVEMLAEKVNEIIDHLNKPKCKLCHDDNCNIERHFYASGPQVTPGTGGNTILTGK